MSSIGPEFEGKTTAVQEFDLRSYRQNLESDPDSQSVDWLVLHYSIACGHCRMLAPQYISIAESYASTPRLRFGAINLLNQENRILVEEKNIRSAPHLVHFKVTMTPEGAYQRTKTRVAHSANMIRTYLAEIYGSPSDGGIVQDSLSSASSNTDHRNTIFSIRSDAIIGLSVLLHYEIFKGSSSFLSFENMEDLSKVLVACESTLQLHSCSTIRNQLEKMIQSGQVLTKGVWEDIIKSHEYIFPPISTVKLRSCSTLSCATWRLLHSISLGGTHLTPQDAMLTIRIIVDKFFSCIECRAHFLQHYDACDFGRCDSPNPSWKDVTLWLWRVHNAVTLRVHPGRGVWPTPQDCPECSDDEDTIYIFIISNFPTASVPPVQASLDNPQKSFSVSPGNILIVIVFILVLVA